MSSMIQFTKECEEVELQFFKFCKICVHTYNACKHVHTHTYYIRRRPTVNILTHILLWLLQIIWFGNKSTRFSHFQYTIFLLQQLLHWKAITRWFQTKNSSLWLALHMMGNTCGYKKKIIIIKHTHKNKNNSPTYERIKANIQAIFYVLLKFSVKKYEMEMGRH